MISHEQIGELYGIYRKYPVVCTDSRNVATGSIFFALRGPSFDGNKYAAQALESGAAYAVVDDPTVVPAGDARFVAVPDSLEALQQLAAHHRRAMGMRIIAITGTNGKTTTKELVTAVLSTTYKVSATRGNLNNHIGVPLVLLGMDATTEIGVVEIGASGPGEIALLCEIAAPDCGLITNIGRAHLEGFGSPEGVAKAKGELYDYLLIHGGAAFVRQDDDVIRQMAGQRLGLVVYPYYSGWGDGYVNKLVGDYNKQNIAAAVAAGRFFQVSELDIRRTVADYTPSNNRSQLARTDKNVVIVDCYNANPSSMEAAIMNMASQAGQEDRKTAMILGDMLELGEWTAEEHRNILDRALQASPDVLLLVGRHFSDAWKGAGTDGSVQVACFDDADALAAWLRETPLVGFTVLLKGSRGMALERLTDYL